MQSLDINEILEKILDHIFDLLKRIDRGVIILLDYETGEISNVILRAPKTKDDAEIIYSRSIVDRVIRDRKPIIMLDTFGQEQSELSASLESIKVRSVMCVPLISRSQLRGVIYVDSISMPYGFREEDLALLTALSSPAAVAIENAMLYANQEKMVEERTRSLRETEKKLRESETRFKAMFNNMSSGVVVYEVLDKGEDFRVLDLNRAERRIEKLRKKEVVGKSISQMLPDAVEAGLIDVFRNVYQTGKPQRRLIPLTRGDKTTDWREYYVYRLPADEIVAIIDDVTDRKKAEEEQKALQKQLFISQKMESIGNFAGGTAHNFRNILQAISGNIEYLEMIHGDKREIKELSESIYDSVEKGVELINSLLQFAKRGDGYQLVELDLADIILKTYEITSKILNKNIRIEMNLEKDLWVKGNHSLLSQVFMNLFSNARDAMPDGGVLTIEAGKEGNHVYASVKDTGHGMDKETLSKIFDPFFTLKDVGKGTGLGLSTTHGIIEQHKGSISVASKLGVGTTFTVSLPLVKSESVKQTKRRKEVVFGNGQKVLIVDDEHPTLDALKSLIKRLGYETIAIDKPEEALKNYSLWSPHVVLMDRNMPEMDGITCVRGILKADPHARIIIVSGYEQSGPDGIDEDIKGLLKGYLTKPCSIKDLSHMLYKALES